MEEGGRREGCDTGRLVPIGAYGESGECDGKHAAVVLVGLGRVQKAMVCGKDHRFFDLRLTNVALSLGLQHPRIQHRVQNIERNMYSNRSLSGMPTPSQS